MLSPERKDVAAIAHRDRETDGGMAIDAEHRLRWIDETAPHRGDIAQPEDAFAGDEVDRLDVALVIERAAETRRNTRSWPVWMTPAGRMMFCACKVARIV